MEHPGDSSGNLRRWPKGETATLFQSELWILDYSQNVAKRMFDAT
jgi:hypothetical protein